MPEVSGRPSAYAHRALFAPAHALGKRKGRQRWIPPTILFSSQVYRDAWAEWAVLSSRYFAAAAYRSARWFCGKTSVQTHYERMVSMSLSAISLRLGTWRAPGLGGRARTFALV